MLMTVNYKNMDIVKFKDNKCRGNNKVVGIIRETYKEDK